MNTIIRPDAQASISTVMGARVFQIQEIASIVLSVWS